MPIVPDDKNWIWVLERVCPECGFEAATFDPLTVRATIEGNALRWRELLADQRATQRPDDNTWSATEYGCHVRDVYRLFLLRLERMLYEDNPTFDNWDQDETAIRQAYDHAQPHDVAGELHATAGMLSARYATVGGVQWQRTGTSSDEVEFTIDSFTRYMIHDPVHHVWDAEQGYLKLPPVPWAPPTGDPAG